MSTAKDEINEGSDITESMARIHGNLMGLRLSLTLFALGSLSEEGIRQYLRLLSIAKESVLNDTNKDVSDSFDEVFVHETGRLIQEIHDSLSEFIAVREVKDE